MIGAAAVQSLDDVAERVVKLSGVEAAAAEGAVEEELARGLVEHGAGAVHGAVAVAAAVREGAAAGVVGLSLAALQRGAVKHTGCF